MPPATMISFVPAARRSWASIAPFMPEPFIWGVSPAAGRDRRSLRRFGKPLPPDQPAADLGSSRADLVELGVSPQAPGRRFVDVAHPAQALDRFARHPGRFFGGVENGAG